jgi:hypothetical protein
MFAGCRCGSRAAWRTKLLLSAAVLPASMSFNALRVLSDAGTLAIGMLLLSFFMVVDPNAAKRSDRRMHPSHNFQQI